MFNLVENLKYEMKPMSSLSTRINAISKRKSSQHTMTSPASGADAEKPAYAHTSKKSKHLFPVEMAYPSPLG